MNRRDREKRRARLALAQIAGRLFFSGSTISFTKQAKRSLKRLVELPDLVLGVLQTRASIRVLTQAPTQLLNLLRRRTGADILPA